MKLELNENSMLLSQTEQLATVKETTWPRVLLLLVAGILAVFILPGLAPGGGALQASQISCATNGWCESDGFDEFITRALVPSNAKAAGLISHVFTMGFCPLIAVSSAVSIIFMHRNKSDGDGDGGSSGTSMLGRGRGRLQRVLGVAMQDCLILLSIFLINIAITDFVKYTAKRERPCFYYNRQSETEAWNSPNQQFVSFFSGDTSIAWVFAVGGVVLSRLRNYAHSFSTHPWTVWGVPPMMIAAGFCAALGSFLRIVGFMHWATDVLAGTACGCIVGFLPRLLFTRAAAARIDGGQADAHLSKTGIAILAGSDSAGGGFHYTQLKDDKLAV